MGIVSCFSVSRLVLRGAWALITTTGKVISGKSAYFRELNANKPATAMANQKLIVKRGYLRANWEIFKSSRQEVFIDFILRIILDQSKLPQRRLGFPSKGDRLD